MRYLLLGLILFGLAELGLLIWLGTKIGVLWVLFIVISTAVAGLVLGRMQGFETLGRALRSMDRQQVPAAEMVDGVCIIIGAVSLITPGLLSDLIGLILLIPFTRNIFKRSIANKLQNMVQKGTIVYRRF